MAATSSETLNAYDIVFGEAGASAYEMTKAIDYVRAEVDQLAGQIADTLLTTEERIEAMSTVDDDMDDDPWHEVYVGVKSAVRLGIEAGYLLVKSEDQQ